VVERGVLVVLVQDLETKVVDPFADEKTRRERERETNEKFASFIKRGQVF